MDRVIRCERVLTPEGERPADVVIAGGRIAALEAYGEAVLAEEWSGGVLIPGVVDCHVHVNEPGRTEWEGFDSATRAAARGGVTAIVDMPLNSTPVTTTVEALQVKLDAARGQTWVDCGFWGGLVPGNLDHLRPLLGAGVRGVKCFLVHSGIDDFPPVTERDLRQALPILAEENAVLLVHAELADDVTVEGTDYQSFLQSRPSRWEDHAIDLMLRLAREYGARIHIVHLSSAGALPALRAARASGVEVTVETCPHYLTLDAESVPAGATQFKCCPPIRDRENQQMLWDGLGAEDIDFVVSDHSPCSPQLKLQEQGDFMGAWGGIASLQFSLPNVWTAARERGFELVDVVQWLAERPAAFVGWKGRKGRIEVGCDADLVLFDPDATLTIEPSMVEHRHKLTPYEGRTLHAVVRQTLLRGRTVVQDGALVGEPGGELILS